MAVGLLVLSQPLGLLGLLGALAMGFGNGPNVPAGSQILIRLAPPAHRTLIFSIKQAGVPLGGALAGLVVAPLAMALGLPMTLGFLIATLLLCCLAVEAFRPSLDLERGPRQPDWAYALIQPQAMTRCVSALRAHPSLPMLTAIGASFSLMQACLTAFTATFVYTKQGASLAEAGQVVALMQASSMIGRIFLGWLADRTGRALRQLGLQAIVSAGAVALLVSAGGGTAGWALYASAALVGFTAVGWNGVHIAELARVAPLSLVSDVTSASSLFAFAASVCGPLIFMGLVGWTDSYEWAFHAMAGQLACLGLISLILRSD
jgi:MFS family permease